MEALPLDTKSHFHARSNSLPSIPHPLVLQCNDHLERLRSSYETSSSSSMLNHKLEGLQDLHECVENLVEIPLMQQAFLHEPKKDLLLDGSLRMLDACTEAKDSLLHTKECMRELQSIMRRRKGGDVELRSEVENFLTSRKVVRKAISKALAKLKCTSKTTNISSTNNKDNETVALISLLENMEVVTLSTFESLMKFISGTTESKSSSRWLLISKLMQTKKIAYSQLEEESEFAQLDEALQSSIFSQTNKSENMKRLQNHLEKMELLIQDLEERLEFLFRHLIKIRVALLNILNH